MQFWQFEALQKGTTVEKNHVSASSVGWCRGWGFQLEVCLGEVCADLNFIAASNETEEPFEAAPFDGVLGLGLPQLAEAQARMGSWEENEAVVFIPPPSKKILTQNIF